MNPSRIAMFIALVAAYSAVAPVSGAPRELVKAQLLADAAAIAPGSTFTVGVLLTIEPRWHVYWLNPGQSGRATRVQLTMPDGFTAGALQWPTPRRFGGGDALVTYGYSGDVLLTADVTAPASIKPGDTVHITAAVDWLVCDEQACLEGDAQSALKLSIADAVAPAHAELFAAWRARLPAPADEAPAWFDRLEVDPGADHRIRIHWRKPVTDVQWYPAATQAMLVDDVRVDTADGESVVRYTFTQVADAGEAIRRVPGVLVFTDGRGERRSVMLDGPAGR